LLNIQHDVAVARGDASGRGLVVLCATSATPLSAVTK